MSSIRDDDPFHIGILQREHGITIILRSSQRRRLSHKSVQSSVCIAIVLYLLDLIRQIPLAFQLAVLSTHCDMAYIV